MNPPDRSGVAPTRGYGGRTSHNHETSGTSFDAHIVRDDHSEVVETADTNPRRFSYSGIRLEDMMKQPLDFELYKSDPRNAPRYVESSHSATTKSTFTTASKFYETGSKVSKQSTNSEIRYMSDRASTWSHDQSMSDVAKTIQSERDDMESSTRKSVKSESTQLEPSQGWFGFTHAEKPEALKKHERASLIKDISHLYNDFSELLRNAASAATRTEHKGSDLEASEAPPNYEQNQKSLNQPRGQKRCLSSGDVREGCEKEQNEQSVATKKGKGRMHAHGDSRCWWYARDPVRYASCKSYCSGGADLQSYRRHHFNDHWRWNDVHEDDIPYERFNAAKHAKGVSESGSQVDVEAAKWAQTYRILWDLKEDDEIPDPSCNQPNHVYFKPQRTIRRALPGPQQTQVSAISEPALQSTSHSTLYLPNPSENQQSPFLDPLTFFPGVDQEDIAHSQLSGNFSFAWDNRVAVAHDLARQDPNPPSLRSIVTRFQSLIDVLRQQQDQDSSRFSCRDILTFLGAFENDYSRAVCLESRGRPLLPLDNDHPTLSPGEWVPEFLARSVGEWALPEPLAGLSESPKPFGATILQTEDKIIHTSSPAPPYPTDILPDFDSPLGNSFVQENPHSGMRFIQDPLLIFPPTEPAGSLMLTPRRPQSRATESELQPSPETPALQEYAQLSSSTPTVPFSEQKPFSLHYHEPVDIWLPTNLEEELLQKEIANSLLGSDV